MNGILVIDKPKEYTSQDIVAIVKKLTKEKVGHTGTLDPNATGVLPLLVGKATEISKYLINHNKTYQATLRLGIKTDTADGEGKRVEEKEVPPLSKENIEQVLQNCKGKQMQVPPMYSAIKIHGKKLYEYARQGVEVTRQARPIEIYETKLIAFHKSKEEIIFEISCSKGTYIRTVCENIAEKLNTVGYMQELRRIKVGDFSIEQAINFEKLRKENMKIESLLLPIENMFTSYPNLQLQEKEIKPFLNGVQLQRKEEDGLYRIYKQNKFIGLGIIQKQQLKRDVVL